MKITLCQILLARDQLNRQTKMYRHARNISDESAQELVKSLCGNSNKRVKKPLWKLDETISLEQSEASRFNGIIEGAETVSAIPMVFQGVCNFFVAQARKKPKSNLRPAKSSFSVLLHTKGAVTVYMKSLATS
jgi:hypothetical protein